MKTEIKKFCTSLEKKLAPFWQSLESKTSELSNISPELGLGDIISGILQNEKELSKLVELIQNEEAYLLIFGPLKSGKSTLMNAISGAYVSEVSSLPAYPCLVYVRNSKSPQYSLSRYDGSTTQYPDNSSLQQVIRESHRDLADAIQKIEEEGKQFQPDTHYPASIKQVDIGLPATALEQSAVVLVDTPGLYAKMRFGYDRMTREFKDRAACALFVVKADNLFLEPVFDEFNELLRSFSRIFLVVNTDHSKRDLGPDGRLRPSLESTAPDQIIEAFRSLAMNASIRKAFEEGRLNVYPIDLLHSAQKVLRGDKKDAEEEGEEEMSQKATAIGHARFQQLCEDLENYLNGSDYVQEFQSDMMRRLERLEAGMEQYLGVKSADQVDTIKESIQTQLRDAEKKVAAIDMLREIDWNLAFENTMREHDEDLRKNGLRSMEKILQKMNQVLDAWFDSDESLYQLEKDRLEPLLERELSSMRKESMERMKALLASTHAGANFSSEEEEALRILNLNPAGELQNNLSETGIAPSSDSPTLHVSVEKLPIRRVLIDYLLFRSKKRVCKSLFGPLAVPTKTIDATTKAKRMGMSGREAILDELKEEALPDLINSPREDGLLYLKEFVTQYRTVLNDMLEDKREDSLTEMEGLRRHLTSFESAEKTLAELRIAFIDLQKSFLDIR